MTQPLELELHMEDLRKRRTKKAITDAFVKLVNERGFVNVTVKEIAEEAMINRQTFYNYYEDKYDLTNQLNDETLSFFNDVLQARVQQINAGKSLKALYQNQVLQSLLKKRELIQALMSIQFDNNSLRQRLQKLVIGLFNSLHTSSMDEVEAIFVSNFYIEMLSYMLKRGRLLSMDEIHQLHETMDKILR